MQPGLTRAVPMGILGFLLGLLLVTLLRALQSIDPVWDAELALTMAAFTTTATFVWGMGATNPAVNAHAHEPEQDEYGLIVAEGDDAHDHHDAPEESPLNAFGYSIWQISFWLIVLMLGLFALATVSFGPALQISNNPSAEPTQVANDVELSLPILGDLVISQFAAFVIFAAFTVLSLGIAGWIISLLMFSASRGVQSAKAVENSTTTDIVVAGQLASGKVEPEAAAAAATAHAEAQIERQPSASLFWGFIGVTFIVGIICELWLLESVVPISPTWLKSIFALFVSLAVSYGVLRPAFAARGALIDLNKVALFFGLFVFSYWTFYYVLIYYPLLGVDPIFGLTSTEFFLGDINVFGAFTLSFDPVLDFVNFLLSAGNAFGVAVTIAYPGAFVRFIGRSARGLANWLRGAPEFLGQK